MFILLYTMLMLPTQFDNHLKATEPIQLQAPYSLKTVSNVSLSFSHSDVIDFVSRYIEHTLPEDKLIEWEENIWIKQSNLFGIPYKGTTYYYSLAPHMSFDPVSRGEVDIDDANIIEDNEDFIIYTLK